MSTPHKNQSDLRIATAVQLYQTEELSLAKAASLAGVSWEQMKAILLAQGIQPRLGPTTIAEAEVQALRAYFTGQAATNNTCDA
ncbi:MAG: UPF0175 family protein [Caldilinea sp.]